MAVFTIPVISQAQQTNMGHMHCSMMETMNDLMEDMDSMRQDMSDQDMKARMNKMHEQMAAMRQQMHGMHQNMGDMMKCDMAAGDEKPVTPEDHEAHHPENK